MEYIFCLGFNDWEVEVVMSFFTILHSHVPVREGQM